LEFSSGRSRLSEEFVSRGPSDVVRRRVGATGDRNPSHSRDTYWTVRRPKFGHNGWSLFKLTVVSPEHGQ
jgi:hypothetical protein